MAKLYFCGIASANSKNKTENIPNGSVVIIWDLYYKEISKKPIRKRQCCSKQSLSTQFLALVCQNFLLYAKGYGAHCRYLGTFRNIS